MVRIEPWVDSDLVRIRITDGYRVQMQSLLTEARIQNSQAMEFSAASTAMELISVTVSIPEFWEALGAAVVAFLKRHENKRVRVEISNRADIDLTGSGYSPSEAERLIRLAAELHERTAAREQDRWTREIEQPPEA